MVFLPPVTRCASLKAVIPERPSEHMLRQAPTALPAPRCPGRLTGQPDEGDRVSLLGPIQSVSVTPGLAASEKQNA